MTLRRLREVPPDRRAITPLAAVASPRQDLVTVTPDEPLAELLGRVSAGEDGRALVLEGERLVGVVSPTDIMRAVAAAERERLRTGTEHGQAVPPSVTAETPLLGAEAYLAAEAVYAASHEGALHLDDVLVRRTRIAMEAADRGLAAATPVSEHLAAVLGWTEDQRAAEVEAYRARVQAERTAEAQPDDPSADATRRQAPDLRGRLLGHERPW